MASGLSLRRVKVEPARVWSEKQGSKLGGDWQIPVARETVSNYLDKSSLHLLLWETLPSLSFLHPLLWGGALPSFSWLMTQQFGLVIF